MSNDKETGRSQSHAGRTEQPDAGISNEQAAKDKKQSPAKRAEHNENHVPDRQFVADCYFCTAQKESSSLPVQVPAEQPVT